MPTTELTSDFVEESGSASVKEVIAEPTSDATLIDIYLGDPGMGHLGMDPEEFLVRIPRGDGGVVIAQRRTGKFQIPPRVQFATELSEIEAALRESGRNGREPKRIVIFGENEKGFLHQIEFSMQLPDAS